MAITNKDIKESSAIFATKDDVENFKKDYLGIIMKKLEDMSIEQKTAYS